MTRKTENRQNTGKPKRRGPGKPFQPGNNANPAGRPKKDFDLVTRCRELTPAIIERYGMMGALAETAAQVLAGRVVLEYGNDKPRQRVELTGRDGGPMEMAAVLTSDERRARVAALIAKARALAGKKPADDDPDGAE